MQKKVNDSDPFESGDIVSSSSSDVLGAIFQKAAETGGFHAPSVEDLEMMKEAGTGIYDTSSDAWYLNYIKQFENTPYYQELLNNPYLRGNNVPFSPNLLQYIGKSIFGDNSAEDSYYASLLQERNKLMYDIIKRNTQYNIDSPANQVQRMALAGQNADLLGTGSVSSAPDNDEPLGSTPMVGAGSTDPLSIVQGFASVLMQAYSFASGFAKDTMTLKSMATGLDNQEFELGSKISQEVDDYVKNHIAEPRFNKDSGSWEFPDLSLDALDFYARERFHNRSSRERFKNGVRSGYGSAQREFLKRGIIKDAQTAQTAMSDAIGVNLSRGASRENLGDSDPIIKVSEELEKMNLKIMKVTQRKDYNTADFHAKYYGALDADKHAKGANDEAEMKSLTKEALEGQREVEKIMNDTLSNVVYGLSKDAKDGNLLAEGLLLFFSAYRSSMIPKVW